MAGANAGDIGPSAAAVTQSLERARRTVATLKAGSVGITSFAMAVAEAIRDDLDVKSSHRVWT